MARRFRHRMLAAILAATRAPLTAVAPAAADPGVYEAEDGLLAGVVAASDTPGFSGSGYVAGFDDAADQVTVAGDAGGLYDLAVVYRSPFADKQTRLLNGAPAGDLMLPGSETFTSVPAGRVLLRAGDNTVILHSNWGWYEIDALRLTPAPVPLPHQVSGALVNPDASAEARSPMTYLTDNHGCDTLSGQPDMASIQWLETNVGKAPAIAGLDMMDYSPSRVERGATSTAVHETLGWDARGGITTFVWHWNAPSGLIDQPGKEWWRGFYTDATTLDLAATLADPGGDDYRLLLPTGATS